MWLIKRLRGSEEKRRAIALARHLLEQNETLKRDNALTQQQAANLAKRNSELEAELRGVRQTVELFLNRTPLIAAFRHFIGVERDGT